MAPLSEVSSDGDFVSTAERGGRSLTSTAVTRKPADLQEGPMAPRSAVSLDFSGLAAPNGTDTPACRSFFDDVRSFLRPGMLLPGIAFSLRSWNFGVTTMLATADQGDLAAALNVVIINGPQAADFPARNVFFDADDGRFATSSDVGANVKLTNIRGEVMPLAVKRLPTLSGHTSYSYRPGFNTGRIPSSTYIFNPNSSYQC